MDDCTHPRRRLTTAVLQAFLDHAIDQGFVILINPAAADEYIQFKRSGGVVYGEAGSRQWDVPEGRRPLSAAAETALAAEGRVGSPAVLPPFDRELHYRRLQDPLLTGPGLALRAGRALRGNFFDQHVDSEDVIRFRAAVEEVQRFDELPAWARDWILKAEQGPLRVRLWPPA